MPFPFPSNPNWPLTMQTTTATETMASTENNMTFNNISENKNQKNTGKDEKIKFRDPLLTGLDGDSDDDGVRLLRFQF